MSSSSSSSPTASRISILDSLGQELLSVVSPVSICMLLVVLLIITLSSSSSSSTSPTTATVTAASLVYSESPSDSPSQKLSGALLNALVFVLLIAAVTFLLLLLYYYNFTRFLKNYTRFSAFFVLSSMGGSIFLSLLRSFSLPLDSFTSFLLLFNFSVLGVASVFSSSFPILVKQSYMVSLAIIVAVWFTKLPEWTTWILLLALAVYDLVAVLCPAGPLRLLVEMASTRDEELPALVYEARATVNVNNNHSSSAQRQQRRPSPLIAGVEMQPPAVASEHSVVSISDVVDVDVDVDTEERRPMVMVAGSTNSNRSSNSNSVLEEEEEEEDDDDGVSRGIRLGLGDFVFYSVLVGRAAMYDLMTVYACYLVIVSGLGCTLMLLTVWRRALPALPISIMLGVAFYFLTRLLMEPFVVGAATSLVMF